MAKLFGSFACHSTIHSYLSRTSLEPRALECAVTKTFTRNGQFLRSGRDRSPRGSSLVRRVLAQPLRDVSSPTLPEHDADILSVALVVLFGIPSTVDHFEIGRALTDVLDSGFGLSSRYPRRLICDVECCPERTFNLHCAVDGQHFDGFFAYFTIVSLATSFRVQWNTATAQLTLSAATVACVAHDVH